jgi:Family of unknown function (DUF5989)
MSESLNNEFARAAKTSNRGGIISEIWYLISHNGKWWLIPFWFSLLIMGAILSFAGTGAAPFIYTLF